MIPEFDAAGNLPLGIHDATLDEVHDRFGGHKRREEIMQSLLDWLGHMKQAGCRIVYIDGSFVTAKHAPNDFDACYNPTGVDIGKLEPCLMDRTADGIARIKTRFGGDIRIDYEFPPGMISPYVRFFMQDGRTGRQKGIVRLDLGKELL